MQINVKMKPIHVSGFNFIGRPRTQDDLLRIICAGHLHKLSPVSEYGLVPLHHGQYKSTYIRAYSLEKHRKKVVVFDKPVKWTKKELRQAGFDGTEERYHKRKVISLAHWTAVYYDIPVSLLEAAKLKVVQGNRTFKLVAID